MEKWVFQVQVVIKPKTFLSGRLSISLKKPCKPAKLVHISNLTKFCADLAVNIKTGGVAGVHASPKITEHCSIVQYQRKRVGQF